jgi:hypothetical protein
LQERGNSSDATLVFISAYGVRLLWHKITIPLLTQLVSIAVSFFGCGEAGIAAI